MTAQNKKIVIVEDDSLLAIVLKKMAMSMNFDVLDISQTGQAAIQSIEKNKPDLIFMDIFLADTINGIEVMKKVREYSNVPVIYITAQSDFSIRRDAGDVDNSFFMQKPINMSELKIALNGIQFAA